jgi:hypothetical protein
MVGGRLGVGICAVDAGGDRRIVWLLFAFVARGDKESFLASRLGV